MRQIRIKTLVDDELQGHAARAGAAKETLYRHFGNKEEWFAEFVRRRSARITGGRDGELDMNGTPREVLGRLGLNLLQFLTLADSLSFFRIMIAEAVRAPELGRIFTRKVRPAVTASSRATFAAPLGAAGSCAAPNPSLPPNSCSGRLSPTTRFLESLRQALSLPREKIPAHVEEAVELFLARYGPSL